jgi:hypothetical protein
MEGGVVDDGVLVVAVGLRRLAKEAVLLRRLGRRRRKVGETAWVLVVGVGQSIGMIAVVLGSESRRRRSGLGRRLRGEEGMKGLTLLPKLLRGRRGVLLLMRWQGLSVVCHELELDLLPLLARVILPSSPYILLAPDGRRGGSVPCSRSSSRVALDRATHITTTVDEASESIRASNGGRVGRRVEGGRKGGCWGGKSRGGGRRGRGDCSVNGWVV